MILRKIFILFSIFLITSVSAFADDGYTNTLMGLEFAPAGNDSVNMVVMTKAPYEGNLSLTRRDASTYILTLPNINSSAPNPDLSKTYQISNVSIRTMPPSSSGNGYTKITVKTSSPIELAAKNTIFQKGREDVVRREEYSPNRQNYNELYRHRRTNNTARQNYNSQNYNSQNNRRNYDRNANNTTSKRNDTERANLKKVKVNSTEESTASNPIQTQSKTTNYDNKYSNENSTEQILLILGSILVAAASIFFFIKAKNKMVDIAGERLDIDLEEDNSSKTKKQESKSKKNQGTRKTINDLDKKYSNPQLMPKISHYSEHAPVMSVEKSTDDMDIVDLDALFNEQKNQTSSEENDALEDFLSEYSFDDNKSEKKEEISEELYKVDEEEYKKLMNNKKLKFSKEDINCIDQILNSEINSDVMNNIDKYLTSNPISNKPTRKSLDELVTTYTISQNISFNNNDIKTLEKLMNVELDQDFVTDLRTDPERTKAMEKQILDFQNSELKKPSEIVTLKVSDLLPNLSDVLANPAKYEEKEAPKYEADENSLLKNIENVTFKPFDDGSRKFEILNDFSDEPQAVVELYSDDFIAKKKSAANTEKPAEKPLPVKQPAANINTNPQKITTNNKTATTKENLKCIMDGKSYSVISSAAFTKNIGCHLAKADDGYFVLSYSGSNIALLKKLPEIKTEKIQARLSDKLANGTYRFIIRIGNVKFVADLKNNCINYVMDL